MSNPDTPLKIALGGPSSMTACKTETLAWADFVARMSSVKRDRVTCAEYQSLPPDDHKRQLKAAAGWWVGGVVEGNERKGDNVSIRYVLNFDLDKHESLPGVFESLFRDGKTGTPLDAYEYFWHTTRSHTPEAPRVRIILPLARPVPVALFTAVSVIAATMLCQSETNISGVDEVSFRPAQLMFFSAANADGEFSCGLNAGTLIDADLLTADWGDKPLPATGIVKKRVDRKQDPTEKTGVVGDFCRAYDIHEAIAEFIPDIYQPTEQDDRYTYANGTNLNGLQVHEDGLFATTFHGSDPLAAYPSANAFDMVRVHKFGHLDGKMGRDVDPSTLPSWKAMVKLMREDTRVLDAKKSETLRAFTDIGAEDVAPAVEGAEAEKKAKPEFTYIPGSGKLEATANNLQEILKFSGAVGEVFAYNERLEKVCVTEFCALLDAALPDDCRVYPRVIQDHDYANLMGWLSAPPNGRKKGYGVSFGIQLVYSMVGARARERRFNDVVDEIDKTPWDGVPRLDQFFTRYLGLEESAYHTEVSRVFFEGAALRTLSREAVQLDVVPILIGAQECGKSTFVGVLNPKGVKKSVLEGDLSDTKRVVENLSGAFVTELAELASLSRTDVNALKSFITEQSATFRKAFGREAAEYIRRFVLIGTSNTREFMRDETGNRRFAPLVIPDGHLIDWPAARDEVPQVWAEAFHRVRNGLNGPTIIVGAEARAEARARQDVAGEFGSDEMGMLAELAADVLATLDRRVTVAEARDETPDDALLATLPDGALVVRSCVRVHDIARMAFGMRVDATAKAAQTAKIARLMGWASVKRKVRGAQAKYRARPGVDLYPNSVWCLPPVDPDDPLAEWGL